MDYAVILSISINKNCGSTKIPCFSHNTTVELIPSFLILNPAFLFKCVLYLLNWYSRHVSLSKLHSKLRPFLKAALIFATFLKACTHIWDFSVTVLPFAVQLSHLICWLYNLKHLLKNLAVFRIMTQGNEPNVLILKEFIFRHLELGTHVFKKFCLYCPRLIAVWMRFCGD